MALQWLQVFVGAFAGAAAALAAGYAWYRVAGRRQLDEEVLRIQEEFERRVQKGVRAAGEELLPAFRQGVADGMRDAIRELHPAGLAEDAAKVMSGAADVLGSGLANLFGLKKKP